MKFLSIRDLDPQNNKEIKLVATRMGLTLVDVLGEPQGQAMYSQEWLINRVQEHIDKGHSARILLAEIEGEIVAHAIVRIEKDETSAEYGFFSTIYVEPDSRNKGVAGSLVEEVLLWCKDKNLNEVIYNTATDNQSIIKLFTKFGFYESLQDKEMIQLKLIF